MSWIILALIPPFIWSILNHSDKYLISKYSHHVGIGGLSILSSSFAITTLPLIYAINTEVLDVTFVHALSLIITGILTSLGILFYLYALDRDDASHVVPFWFLTPVFSYIMGVLVLGELLSSGKIIGSIIVLLGALILSLELESGFKIKKITPLLMVASSIFLSVNSVLFKDVSETYSFWISLFWNQVGFVTFAIILLIFFKKFRLDFMGILKINSTELAVLNVIGEFLQIIATSISYYVILIAPVSLVLLISYCSQPLFVLIGGVAISYVFPSLTKEKFTTRHLLQKIVAILLMAVGVYQIMI